MYPDCHIESVIETVKPLPATGDGQQFNAGISMAYGAIFINNK